MFETKLQKFIAKRVLVLFVLLAILDLIFVSHRWMGLLGLLIGAIFSLLRFGALSSAFYKLIPNAPQTLTVKKSIYRYIINQLVAIVLLAASLKFSLYLFGGAVAGILLVPLVIIINAITESIGITHNEFE